ncbi:MAG: tetratricopeptide repeat protein [Desulfobacterales bacterium]|jgi:hypothetical protein|nr:tetratricopeptide repeat protein [Desulfobacterales bacterium]
MPSKITHALARREADTYRSQGLPQEALQIYQDLLASAPPLPVDTQAAIRDQIQRIKIEIQCDSVDECATLSAEHIALIRQGWSPEATPQEIFVSAGSFCEVGCYAEALQEFQSLIRKGVPAERMSGLLASCLRHLHRPENLASAVDRLAAEAGMDPVAGGALRVAVAEKLFQQGHVDHAVSMVLALSRPDGAVPEPVRRRLAALSAKMARVRPDTSAPEPGPAREHRCTRSGTGAVSRLLIAVRNFAGRLTAGH